MVVPLLSQRAANAGRHFLPIAAAASGGLSPTARRTFAIGPSCRALSDQTCTQAGYRREPMEYRRLLPPPASQASAEGRMALTAIPLRSGRAILRRLHADLSTLGMMFGVARSSPCWPSRRAGAAWRSSALGVHNILVRARKSAQSAQRA